MVTQPVPGPRTLGLYGVNSTGAVSFPFLALFCRHTGVCAADFAVNMHRRLPLHSIGNMAVNINVVADDTWPMVAESVLTSIPCSSAMVAKVSQIVFSQDTVRFSRTFSSVQFF